MTQTLETVPCVRGKDSASAIEWINQVLEQRPEARPYDFAASAGVSRKTITNLLGPDPRPSLYSPTYERIMSTGPEDIRLSRYRLVSGVPAQRIVDSLTSKGWTLTEIAEAAGLRAVTLASKNLGQVHIQTITRLMDAKRILDARTRSGLKSRHTVVPSFHMLRRVEALMAMGWGREEIAKRAGVGTKVVRTTSPRVALSVSDAVSAAYDSMRLTPGGSEITSRRARQYGFAPWSAWPNGSIDVEGAVPDWDFVDDKEWREAIRARYES